MHVLAASVSGEIFNGEADTLSVPSEMGELTILPHHQVLVSLLAPGEIVITHGKEKNSFAITGGVLEINEQGHVSVLVQIDG